MSQREPNRTEQNRTEPNRTSENHPACGRRGPVADRFAILQHRDVACVTYNVQYYAVRYVGDVPLPASAAGGGGDGTLRVGYIALREVLLTMCRI